MSYHPSFLSFAKGLVGVVALTLLSCSAQAEPDSNVRLIRDTEIESILKEWTAPVIKADGLDPDAIRFIIVQSNDINAFVAGGQNIFIFTGLLEKSQSPGEIVGVIAHELGHITGGHLVGMHSAMENASYESLLGAVLGIGAAALTGRGDVGAAVISGSRSTALNRFLAFSRAQESSADQAALAGLEKAGMSASGLLSFMKTMESGEALPENQQAAWVRTHPLTHDRIEAVEAGLARSANTDAAFPAAWQEEHDRMIAKLKAFITPEHIAWDYSDHDTSVAAAYAHTIAAYRENNVDTAFKDMDALLTREPDNPFFLELKGQILTDFGKVEDALAPYRRSIALHPDAPLIRIAYANALIETSDKDKKRLDEAIQQLDRAARDEPRTTRIYRLLATAYGRKGQEPMARLFLAEEAYLNHDLDYAKKLAESAAAGLEKDSAAALRAQDILSHIEQGAKKD